MREGLSAGERVVVSANFLIDAESNLKAALEAFSQTGAADMLRRLIQWSARNSSWSGGHDLVTIAGIYAVAKRPLDAMPDLSDVQVIVFTEYPGQAPQVVEDQVTYPLTTAMLSVPKSQGRARLLVLRRRPSSTSSSRTAPTSTGPAPACWNT